MMNREYAEFIGASVVAAARAANSSGGEESMGRKVLGCDVIVRPRGYDRPRPATYFWLGQEGGE